MRKVIVNTTPLIALAGIGQLDLLRKLYSEITIPRSEVKPLLDGLINDGLYVSQIVQSYVLEQAGEK